MYPWIYLLIYRSTCQDQKSAENINPCNFLQNEWHEIPRMDEHLVYIQMEVSWNGGSPQFSSSKYFRIFHEIIHPATGDPPCRWMSMLGLASVLFCTLVAGVRYWDGSYFDASGLESRVFWGMLFWVCHVSKPGNYMDLTQIYGDCCEKKGFNHWILVGHFETTPDQYQA